MSGHSLLLPLPPLSLPRKNLEAEWEVYLRRKIAVWVREEICRKEIEKQKPLNFDSVCRDVRCHSSLGLYICYQLHSFGSSQVTFSTSHLKSLPSPADCVSKDDGDQEKNRGNKIECNLLLTAAQRSRLHDQDRPPTSSFDLKVVYSRDAACSTERNWNSLCLHIIVWGNFWHEESCKNSRGY